AGWYAQQIRDQWGRVPEVAGRLAEQGLQLVQPLRDCVVAPESGRPFELGDSRMERAVLVVRRAEQAQWRMWLAAQPLQNRLSDARFADARLARYQHDGAIAAFCLLPAAHQQINLFFAADQRRSHRAQGLEAALDCALPDHLMGLHRYVKTLYFDGAEIAVF